ncbi:hypothetical protein [Neobacillus niacini]
MWIVVVKYSRNNEVFLYESLEEAKKKYDKVIKSGRVAYLASLLQTNL